MATFLKSLILSFLIGLGATAQAQCVPAPMVMGQGYQGGHPCWGGVAPQVVIQQPYGYGQQVMAPQYGYSNGIPMYGAGMPMASGLNQCQMLGGIVGGTLGSFARNYQAQAIILGAVGGSIAGNALCYNGAGQRVMVVPQQNAGQYMPVGGQQQLPPAQVIPPVQQQAPQFPGGDLRCPLRFNGQEVQAFFVKDSDTCMALVEYEARRRGWVRQ